MIDRLTTRLWPALALLATTVVAKAADLKIGDMAPRLSYDRWLKGEPIKNFEKGHVYVLEFWATWCGPCRVAMPHLSELSKKYKGKVTFIGVDIWEEQHPRPDGNYDLVVDKFLSENGDLMSYNVCTGSKDGAMVKNWMAAGGQDGIPATFVVDQSGRVCWIGHPVSLDEPLEKIVAGTYDMKAFGEAFEKKRASMKAYERTMAENFEPIKRAIAEKRFEDAVKAADKAMAKVPEYRLAFAIPKFEALMSIGMERALTEAVKLQNDWDQAYIAGQDFVMKEGLERKYYQFALDVFLKQHKERPEVFSRLTLIAMAYSKLGDHKLALDYQTRYVEKVRATGAGEVVMRELEKELQKYKEAAGKG